MRLTAASDGTERATAAVANSATPPCITRRRSRIVDSTDSSVIGLSPPLHLGCPRLIFRAVGRPPRAGGPAPRRNRSPGTQDDAIASSPVKRGVGGQAEGRERTGSRPPSYRVDSGRRQARGVNR